jgi:iron complex transport system permease protein
MKLNNLYKSKIGLLFFGLGAALIVLVLLDLLLGSVSISFHNFFAFVMGEKVEDPVARQILLNFRLPKTIAAVIAGSALAVSGLQMQTIFRNPLAGHMSLELAQVLA